METNLDRYREDIERLDQLGARMRRDLELRYFDRGRKLAPEEADAKRKLEGTFEAHYQRWYTESAAIIRQVIPDRLAEFISLYEPDKKRRIIDAVSYSIQDWLNGVRALEDAVKKEKTFDDYGAMTMRFFTQLQILEAANARFESSLFDIRQLVQADMFDSELEAAKELAKNKFTRAAGALAGVVLEGHLGQVCENHLIKVAKKSPTISDLNDLLKKNGAIEVPEWRFVQHLADVRNLCDHNKKTEPTAAQVEDLITGVMKVTKTLF